MYSIPTKKQYSAFGLRLTNQIFSEYDLDGDSTVTNFAHVFGVNKPEKLIFLR